MSRIRGLARRPWFWALAVLAVCLCAGLAVGGGFWGVRSAVVRVSPPPAVVQPRSPVAPAPAPGRGQQPPPLPSADTASTLDALDAVARADRDLFDLARRLKRVEVSPAPQPPPGGYQVGHQQQFWVTDQETNTHFRVTATLRYVSDHLYMYVEDGRPIATADLRRSADEFEAKIWPVVFKSFGSSWKPGRDGDSHLTVLHTRLPGAAGYYSSADEYPPEINPYSNQRRMVYLNADIVRPGSSGYAATLAHEFQHALHWNAVREEESWVNEGLSELATHLTGYPVASLNAFAADPDTQLNAWPKTNQGTHYGGSYLFMLYLWDHYRSGDSLSRLVAQPLSGIPGINAYLAEAGYRQRFDDVFRDWIIANYLQQPGGGTYGYADERFRLPAGRAVAGGPTSGQVNQYAADYLPLSYNAAGATLHFKGTPSVRVIPTDPPGCCRLWWSNTGDGRDTTLTRAFDLTGVPKATLQFMAWWEIEQDWDYAYVEVSTDGGQTWTVVPATHTTDTNPVGQAYGPGYTGTSGGRTPTWQQETADLSAYAGQQILLRFEYVTDDAVNQTGFAIDDITIPEIGFRDDAEQDQGWQAVGFARILNTLPERYAVAVVYGDGQVDWVPVGADGSGAIALRDPNVGGRPPVLVIAAMTPHTFEAARYEVAITP